MTDEHCRKTAPFRNGVPGKLGLRIEDKRSSFGNRGQINKIIINTSQILVIKR